MRVYQLAVLCFFLTLSTRGLAIDCLASCPSRPIGVMLTSMGGLYVSPARVPASFTGCQIAWDEAKKVSIRLRFDAGEITSFEAFNTGVSPNSFGCFYEHGKLSPVSSPACAKMPIENLGAGLPATPVAEKLMDWPTGACFPKFRKGTSRRR